MEKDLLIFRHLEERREFQRRMLEAKRSHEHEKREVETQTLPAKQERESLRAAFMKARRETIAPSSRGRDSPRDFDRSRHCASAPRASDSRIRTQRFGQRSTSNNGAAKQRVLLADPACLSTKTYDPA